MNERIFTQENIVDFERDIDGLLKGQYRPAPPVAAQDIGRLSAEAVMKQWEQTAKDVENLSAEIKERAAKLEAALQDCDQDLKLLGEAARHILKKGETIRTMIEEANETSRKIRDACADFTKV